MIKKKKKKKVIIKIIEIYFQIYNFIIIKKLYLVNNIYLII